MQAWECFCTRKASVPDWPTFPEGTSSHKQVPLNSRIPSSKLVACSPCVKISPSAISRSVGRNADCQRTQVSFSGRKRWLAGMVRIRVSLMEGDDVTGAFPKSIEGEQGQQTEHRRKQEAAYSGYNQRCGSSLGQIAGGFKCQAKEFINRCFRKISLKRMCRMNWKIWTWSNN